ncbi:hypothetical protein ACFY12_07670 [Streptomyces sp. NPDC001339]|uniref:hypothetical protein n=1 Tax=Streptomyces sp. NPDC001339 TaxID=3364563 RepID=UPI0036D12FCA
MTTLLETRYRAVLRLLPAYYRRAREDEMVETYLWDIDQETADQSRPTVGEVASVAALAVRSRLAATGAPRPYALLGAAARLFVLFAVLLQAASAVVDRVLALTWASTGDAARWEMFASGFTGHGLPTGIISVAGWTLPLLWTAGYVALLRDRRRLARAAVLLAALPTAWPLVAPLVDESVPPDPAYAAASALLAWLTALALCAAYHRDAPPASLPGGSPGLLFMACCVVMAASIVLSPIAADSVWAPATCFLVGALGWLLWRAPRTDQGTACAAVALAALGLLILAIRVAVLYQWLDVPTPDALLAGVLAQTAALVVLTGALAAVAGRGLRTR